MYEYIDLNRTLKLLDNLFHLIVFVKYDKTEQYTSLNTVHNAQYEFINGSKAIHLWKCQQTQDRK